MNGQRQASSLALPTGQSDREPLVEQVVERPSPSMFSRSELSEFAYLRPDFDRLDQKPNK